MVTSMWALIQGGAVVETTAIDPAGRFHASFTWQPCCVEVAPGWLFEGGVFNPPVVDLEELLGIERVWRNAELSATEWLVMRHRDERDLALDTSLSVAQFTELLNYRQALRDWPSAGTFPDSAKRPKAPAWLSEQTQ